MVGAVLRANDRDAGRGAGRLEQLGEGDPERARDAESNADGGVGLAALDLAEHRPAHARSARQGVERPCSFGAQLFDALAQMPADEVGTAAPARSVVVIHGHPLYQKKYLASWSTLESNILPLRSTITEHEPRGRP